MGWTEEQTNAASMPYIENAYYGMRRMFRVMAGQDDGLPIVTPKKPRSIIAQMKLLHEEWKANNGR